MCEYTKLGNEFQINNQDVTVPSTKNSEKAQKVKWKKRKKEEKQKRR